jgi:hypothetical protein
MSSRDRTFEVKQVKTRKDHYCTFCSNTIFAGETCHVWVGVYDGKIARVHSHSECNNLWDGEDYCPGEASVPEAVRLRNLEHVTKFKL